MSQPTFLLNATLADLSGTWLEVRCFKGTTYLPLRIVAASKPENARLRDVLPRLRCSKCQVRPSMLVLVENPAGGGQGGPPPGWRINLQTAANRS
jgi:hypothetical protein